MFDEGKFRYYVRKNGLNLNQTAEAIGIKYSTLYRKMTGTSDFTREEVQKLKKLLHLTPIEADEIFFANKLA